MTPTDRREMGEPSRQGQLAQDGYELATAIIRRTEAERDRALADLAAARERAAFLEAELRAIAVYARRTDRGRGVTTAIMLDSIANTAETAVKATEPKGAKT